MRYRPRAVSAAIWVAQPWVQRRGDHAAGHWAECGRPRVTAPSEFLFPVGVGERVRTRGLRWRVMRVAGGDGGGDVLVIARPRVPLIAAQDPWSRHPEQQRRVGWDGRCVWQGVEGPYCGRSDHHPGLCPTLN